MKKSSLGVIVILLSVVCSVDVNRSVPEVVWSVVMKDVTALVLTRLVFAVLLFEADMKEKVKTEYCRS